MASGGAEPPPEAAPAAGVPALELEHITMRFGSFLALRDVGLQVGRGEIVGLLGENGSGKSTLVKVLAGVNAPEPGGQLRLGGQPVALPLAPGQFRDLGLSFVHQDLGLARTLTVAENLLVGERGSANSHRPISWRAEHRRVRALLDSYHVSVDPAAPVNQLPPVGQALVAIVRAAEELRLYRQRGDVEHSILFLDEPTVFLPEHEVEFLFDLVRRVVTEGASTVFISHDLSAVRALCHRVVVLRDGQVAGQAAVSGISDEKLVELIVGPASAKLAQAGQQAGRAGAVQAQPPVCEVRHLQAARVRDLSLAIRPAEVVGLAGLLGSGADDVPYLLFGASPCDQGTLSVGGWQAALARLRPSGAVSHQIALVPADRRRDAIAPSLSVAENSTILVSGSYARFGRVQARRLRALVRQLLEKFDVRPRNPGATLGQLSGGNQQRVVLAKWLEIKPKLLLLHEPTQGVDVAARAAIYRLVREAAASGMATLWVSSDFEELATVCDRVLIMADGHLRSELTGEITEDAISSAVYHYSTDAAAVLAETPEERHVHH